jgi:hypothetical protein
MIKRIFYKTMKSSSCKLSSLEKPWTISEEFDDNWKQRISLMASYIDMPGCVADFGCGMMWLENFLKSGNIYVPIDYIRRDERTIVIDLNVDPISAINADIAFLSGILEYIKDIPQFISQLTDNNFKLIILSYCTIEKNSDVRVRKSLNWVSHVSVFELLSLFINKYNLTAIDDFNSNTVLVFKKKTI